MIIVALVYTENSTFQQQWEYVLCNFKPDKIYTIGSPDIERPESYVFRETIQVDTIADIKEDFESVLLAPDNGMYYQGTESLETFNHPEDCIYIFGSDSRHMTEDYLGDYVPHHLVYVPTDTNDDMYSFVCCAVTLYDRKIKNGNR